MANILLLDNIDSFTYNLVEQLRNQKNNVLVYRNTVSIDIIFNSLKKLTHPILMLSPGPSLPKHAGCMLDLIKKVKGDIPIVGICLGHQAIVEAYGGIIGYAGEIFHGKASLIRHDGLEMFEGVPQPLPVARYHSLICNKIPEKFVINSYFEKMIMSVRNNCDRVCGFQFHPESILTTHGDQILEKIIHWASLKYITNKKQ
ncbi:anthranilate synthase small subunit (plasmid) [Buchnera aphidicola str. APS (Acyrthosiphon pisum)]|uniref:Anthranilate synthase component 2 n=1 Tax=Buchnera aphidicola subsp. Acyrthosiphon pisum (strain APS) TaxID=107806 RepID=TRPG_BUCAI|nr:anthranilate synthase component II [Buchnera aphidicola]Q44696.2 RecName: Full=Anthranilate synthase component 2; Short=AS; Short=ASII; AltName: Full=Anthranilate synthase, GATase component; AltName: Full=Anthranilate synthase, glutamine amidotransferase component [Buchnera aphidicola str. APS (Acyrthosiphon pisum)]AAS02054.1 anthranilate synthase small subunit [Buchnera aphidicola str. APS (Acyrthosiphon pisum)]BAA95418.1 anthranilate synthase small subunit [Buchnera aphidicola str. APS (Acy